MIYITGDIHGNVDFQKLNINSFTEQNEMMGDDYLIILGDFGCIWYGNSKDNYLLNDLGSRKFTTLFIDGNHENFPALNSYPEENWNGGRIHRIRPNVIHLMRGQVFEFSKLKWFTMGGASSHDKMYRKENVSWWKEELPNNLEFEEALTNLDKHNWKVDFVLSHCMAGSMLPKIFPSGDGYEEDCLTKFFDTLEERLNYFLWFSGHYHINRRLDDKHIVLYEQIIKILN